MNVFFALIKDGRDVLHQSCDRKLWESFISGITNSIPDTVIADVNKFLYHSEKGLTVEECSEFHLWDYETGIEKICYNLSDENLIWKTKRIEGGE